MWIENANNNKAIATSFPPYCPRIPCEKAFAVNSAELTNDLPLIVISSILIFPLNTFIVPEYKSDELLSVITISSAIDLEWITVIFLSVKVPLTTLKLPENSLTLELRFWTYFVNSSISFGYK